VIGASRPRITEHLILFEHKHLVSRHGRQLVVNRERLQSYLTQTRISPGKREFGKPVTP